MLLGNSVNGQVPPWLLDNQIDIEVQCVGERAFASQSCNQVNRRIRLDIQVDVATAAVIVHARAKQPDPRVLTQVAVDLPPNSLRLIGR